jgi:hypothetical protein
MGQHHTGSLTGFWFLLNRPKGWILMNEYVIYLCGHRPHNTTWDCRLDTHVLDLNTVTESQNHGPVVIIVEQEAEDFQGCIVVPYKMISQLLCIEVFYINCVCGLITNMLTEF